MKKVAVIYFLEKIMSLHIISTEISSLRLTYHKNLISSSPKCNPLSVCVRYPDQNHSEYYEKKSIFLFWALNSQFIF